MFNPAGSMQRAPGSSMGKGVKFQVGSRELRTVNAEEINKYPTGETGGELSDLVNHCEGQLGDGYGLANEDLLGELHAEPNKIADLMSRMGETRDNVSIVVRTAGGGFTRMFVHKEGSTYKETEKSKSTEEDSTRKTKTHRQEADLFVFERGAKNVS